MKKALTILLLLLIAYLNGSAQNCETPFYTSNDIDNTNIIQIKSNHLQPGDTTITSAASVFTQRYYGWYLMDSLFIDITHENNSGEADTIIVYAYPTNDSFPVESPLLWSDTIITNQGLSPNNNWQGTNAINKLTFIPLVYVNVPISICIKYYGNITDTFGLVSSYGSDDELLSSFTSNIFPDWYTNYIYWALYPSGANFPWAWSMTAHGCYGLIQDDLNSNICGLALDSTLLHWKVYWTNTHNPLVNKFELTYSKSGPYGYHGDWGIMDLIYIEPASNPGTLVFPSYATDNLESITVAEYDTLNRLIFKSTLIPFSITGYTNNAGHAKLELHDYITQSFIASDTIVVYKGASPYNLSPYDTLAAFTATYTDEAPGSYGYYYQLKRKLLSDCAIDSITSNIVPSAYLATPEQAYFGTDITLYPNPAQTTLNINFGKATATDISIQVLNATGQLVYKCSKNAGAILTLDISVLPTGLYLVQLQTGNTVKVLRFVKN